MSIGVYLNWYKDVLINFFISCILSYSFSLFLCLFFLFSLSLSISPALSLSVSLSVCLLSLKTETKPCRHFLFRCYVCISVNKKTLLVSALTQSPVLGQMLPSYTTSKWFTNIVYNRFSIFIWCVYSTHSHLLPILFTDWLQQRYISML